jgi:hypothetical protein
MAGKKGRSGRPRIPVELHVARGTFRADRHAAPPAPLPAGGGGGLFVPTWLADDARELWQVLERELGAMVAPTDAAALALLAETYALLGRCLTAARKNPTDPDTRNAIAAYGKLVESLAGQFGLTPAARAALGAPRSTPPRIATRKRG